MIRGTLTAFSAAALAVVVAVPADAAVFRGSGRLVSVTGTCPANFWNPGAFWTARYRPGGILGNPAESSISMFQDFGNAFNYRSVSGDFNPTALSAIQVTQIFNSTTIYNSTAIVVRSPTSITTSTVGVNLRATISNFDQAAGCTATIIFTLQRAD